MVNNIKDDYMNDDELNIDVILQAVESANQDDIPIEQILTPEELQLYNEYIGDNNTDVSSGHYDNLVGIIDDQKVKRLAQDVIDWVRWDEDSRKEWQDREVKGLRLLGLSDKTGETPLFKGASTVTHPLLIDSVVQFHSRVLGEIWPPEGPVKAIVLGEKTPDKMQQAKRVEDYLNYQYTEDMSGGFDEEDMMLFRLPISGSCFKKAYYDPTYQKICSRFIEPSDFIAPFSATDLETAPRYTHRYRQSHNVVKKLIVQGYYANIPISEPTNEQAEYPVVKSEIDDIEGKERVSQDDNRHTILEMYVDLELEPDFEYALPYIVFVDRDEQKVLRIQRNWRPTDGMQRKRINVSHYRFKPGLGFYGLGLLHLIGGLAKSSTGSLRALLDSAAFDNLQGGYRSSYARIKGGDEPLAPGEWREIDSSPEELKNAFFPIPYKEPSGVMFQLLGYLDERSQRIVGTNDLMSGDANPNAPVGTTLALIEQGGKSFADILRRIHKAHRDEFRIVAELNSQYLPDDGYPYITGAGDKLIMASDFDERVDVIPVSDPNIISNSQRIVQSQAVLDMAEKYPGQIDLKAAIKSMMEAIRITNVDELLAADEETQQMQQKAAMLDIQIREAELAKLNAEKEKIDADKAESLLRAMFSAMQSANLLVQNPDIGPLADELFRSSGGKDYNGPPIVTAPQAAIAPIPNIPQNTSPGFPANPKSPVQGVNAGIETPQNETLQ